MGPRDKPEDDSGGTNPRMTTQRVILGFMPRIHHAANAGVFGTMDPRTAAFAEGKQARG